MAEEQSLPEVTLTVSRWRNRPVVYLPRRDTLRDNLTGTCKCPVNEHYQIEWQFDRQLTNLWMEALLFPPESTAIRIYEGFFPRHHHNKRVGDAGANRIETLPSGSRWNTTSSPASTHSGGTMEPVMMICPARNRSPNAASTSAT